jgi:hypothetical protein
MCYSLFTSIINRGGNHSGWVEFGFKRVGLVKIEKKISDSGRSDLCWVGCQIEYYQIFLGYFGSGFEFLIAHANSDFGPFGSKSGQILGHLILDSLGFWFVSGWVRFFFL